MCLTELMTKVFYGFPGHRFSSRTYTLLLTFLFSASPKGRRTVTWSTARPALPCYSLLLIPYALGSRRRSTWIMSSTSCLVRMPLRSNGSTSAEVSHMLEMASSSRDTRSLGSSGWAMMLSLLALLHPPSALRAVRGSGVACRQILRQRTGPAAQTRRLMGRGGQAHRAIIIGSSF